MQASSSSSSAPGTEFEEFLKTIPPGFRFCPTDKELLEDYLNNKIHNRPLPLNFIPQVKLYDNDPSQLIGIENIPMGRGQAGVLPTDIGNLPELISLFRPVPQTLSERRLPLIFTKDDKEIKTTA
ncbi:No apical meristem (NAM) protein [Corchorus olitorius]|uniref:No apical meristem (NAM) protein n=1 Tax=Corchorus olitorius TaxID=93759 RepID=A0A1R3HMC5_9ROSI|nr:No apical meristem (NAM) protein [Corchorus olitorius]